MSFPCTSCGACCRRIGIAVKNIEQENGKQKPGDPMYFPHDILPNGHCSQLAEDNTCRVYQDRPLICNIDKFMEWIGVNQEVFYNANAFFCNRYQEEDRMDEKYRVKT